MYLLFSVMNSLLPKYYTNTLQGLDCFIKHSFNFVSEGEGMNNVNSDCILQKNINEISEECGHSSQNNCKH